LLCEDTLMFRRNYLPLMVSAIAYTFSGCSGSATQKERLARQKLIAIASTYQPGTTQGQEVVKQDSSLDSLLELSIRRSPAVAAAYYDWVAAVERITIERSLPDLRLTFEAEVQNVVMELLTGVMAELAAPGKLELRGDVAAEESGAKYALFRKAAVQAAASFRVAYYELQAALESIAINKQSLELLKDLHEVAKTQHASGRASLQDVLRSEIAIEELQVQLFKMEDAYSLALVKYRAVLGFDRETDISAPLAFQNSEGIPSVEQIYEIALRKNPSLLEMESEIRRAEATVSLARKNSLPDFAIGMEVDVKPAKPILTPQLQMTLPLWRDRIRAEIEAGLASFHAANARLHIEKLNLAVEFASMVFMLRESSRELRVLEEHLIPKARGSLDLARSGYIAGRSSFFDFLEGERALLRFQLARIEVRKNREVALTNLSLTIPGIIPVPEMDEAERHGETND
jgi:outer membrane protein, heavy metal efflux system